MHRAIDTRRSTIVPEQITHILVPVDFGVHADGAIEFAVTIAQRFGGTVDLLHVVEDPFVSGAWNAEAFTPNIPELLDQMIADAHRRLDKMEAAAADEGIPLATKVVTGKPSHAIVEHAKTGAFDLIVMSSHGRTTTPRPRGPFPRQPSRRITPTGLAWSSICASALRADEISDEPVARELLDFLERSRLLEQMGRTPHDVEFDVRCRHVMHHVTIHLDHRHILAADDE
jgi:nucleotide-binding universal stress UspA family protein